MIRQWIIAILFLPNILKAQSNLISDEQIQQFINYRPPYKQSNGKYYGAGFQVDAFNMYVLFREVSFDQKSKELVIKGTTFHTVVVEEARLNGVEVFLARPRHNKLKSIRVLGYSKTSDRKNGNDGDFEFRFKLLHNERLYFLAGESFYLLEYDISKAL